jgi:hypothetical protein
MTNKDYQSFMLRFRCAQNDGCPTWIVSLQDTQTSQQQWFTSLNGLFEFLQSVFGSDLKLEDAGSTSIQGTESLKQSNSPYGIFSKNEE